MREHSKRTYLLSSSNFWGKQTDLLERAQPGTGRWILEDERFTAWLDGETRSLWCHGHAGAGKTILSSIIIDHLCSTIKSKDCAIAWLYIDYRDHDLHTIDILLANLLVQLFEQHGQISKSMTQSLGSSVIQRGARPAPAEYKAWLQEDVQRFNRVFVVIDALDEMCTQHIAKLLIAELQILEPTIHLLVTSRPDLGSPFSQENSHEIEILPREHDVILFTESRLKASNDLWNQISEDSFLRQSIIENLTKANHRM